MTVVDKLIKEALNKTIITEAGVKENYILVVGEEVSKWFNNKAKALEEFKKHPKFYTRNHEWAGLYKLIKENQRK